MALPTTGGGYQLGDGNTNEVLMTEQVAPASAVGTATLTVAQITNGILVAIPGTAAATYTLPSVASLEADITNAKVNSSFEFSIINTGTSSGVVTIAVGTGWSITGLNTTALAASAGSSSRWRCRKTGVGTWTIYRIS